MRKFLTVDKFRAAVRAGETIGADVAVRSQFIAEVKAAEDDSRALTFTISTASVDRQGDTIAVDGWDLTNFRRNPVVLWAHDYSSLPVGRSISESIDGGALKSQVEFTPKGMVPFNDVVFDMYKGGFLSAVSVGFLPRKYAFSEDTGRTFGIDFKEQELLEYSAVPVPANPEALIEARSAGVDTEAIEAWARSVLGGRRTFEQSIEALSIQYDELFRVQSGALEAMKTASEVFKLRLKRLEIR